MTAIIMCGGKMKFLSEDIPKAELSLCGRKMFSYAADSAGFADRVIISGSDDACAPDSDLGSSLNEVFRREDNITAPFIVLFGDVLCTMDLSAGVSMNMKRGGVTVLAALNADGEYYSDKSGHISREKTKASVGSICGFVISSYPAEGFFNGGADDVVNSLSEKYHVSVYSEKCFMLDIAAPQDIIRANRAVITGEYEPAVPFPEGYFSPKGVCCGGAECRGNVYIGKGCVIDSGVRLSAGTAIGDCVYIGRGAELEDCTVMNGAYIGERVKLKKAVVCPNARLLNGGDVCEGVLSGESVSSEFKASDNILFDSEGRICGGRNGIDPSFAAAAGSAAVRIGRKICIGCRRNDASDALMRAFSAGVNAAGGEAVIAGEVSEPMLRFAVRLTGSDCGVYIGGEDGAELHFCASDGLPLDEESRRITENAAVRREYCHAGYRHYGTVTECGSVGMLYENMLDRLVRADISGIFADVSSPDEIVYKVCRSVFSRHGACRRDAPRISFHISGDGRRVSAYSEETGYVFHDKVMMLCIMRLKELGIDNIAVSSALPSAADSICPLVRYEQYPDYSAMSPQQVKSDLEARKLASELPFTEDGAAAAVILTDHLAANGITLAQAAAALPKYALAERFVPMKGSSEILKRIIPSAAADKRGKVVIRPLRTGGGVMLHVESYAMEAAAELCGFYEELISKGHI